MEDDYDSDSVTSLTVTGPDSLIDEILYELIGRFGDRLRTSKKAIESKKIDNVDLVEKSKPTVVAIVEAVDKSPKKATISTLRTIEADVNSDGPEEVFRAEEQKQDLPSSPDKVIIIDASTFKLSAEDFLKIARGQMVVDSDVPLDVCYSEEMVEEFSKCTNLDLLKNAGSKFLLSVYQYGARKIQGAVMFGVILNQQKFLTKGTISFASFCKGTYEISCGTAYKYIKISSFVLNYPRFLHYGGSIDTLEKMIKPMQTFFSANLVIADEFKTRFAQIVFVN
jgi:hypothetical protein